MNQDLLVLRETRPYESGKPRKIRSRGRVFPPCPECGAQRRADGTPLARAMTTYYANDGEVPCYYVKCLYCGHNFDVGMFALPPAASQSALDEIVRIKRRDQNRKRFGYVPNGETDTSTRGGKRFSSDRIRATISILPGKVAKSLRWRRDLERVVKIA